MNLHALCAAVLTACAPGPREGAAGIEADAVLWAGEGWHFFRFGTTRHVRVAARVGDGSAPMRWLEIASPSGAFRPVFAAAGWPSGSVHFYLLDAAGRRLCLYDSGAALLSTFPMPAGLPPPAPGRLEFFRGHGGAFTFVDYLAGEAWQYADRQGVEGGADWILRNRVKMPLGLEGCLQEPGSLHLVCRLRGQPVRFDPSLNRAETAPATHPAYSLIWEPESGEWRLEAPKAAMPFRFWPSSRRLVFTDSTAP